MTREIKFRGWHIEKDKQHVLFHEGTTNISNTYYTQQSWMHYYNAYSILDSAEDIKSGKVILMQYTGLKDKNEIEIYEGDIVEYTGSKCPTCGVDYKYTGHELYPINWSVKNCAFICENKGNFIDSIVWSTVMVVVGNIYENPELLKGENQRMSGWVSQRCEAIR